MATRWSPATFNICMSRLFGHRHMLKVAGDHRVVIFAKLPIEARVELFYDYGHAPRARSKCSSFKAQTSA